MNFGHAGFDKFIGIGINGKTRSLHAANGTDSASPILEEIFSTRKIQLNTTMNCCRLAFAEAGSLGPLGNPIISLIILLFFTTKRNFALCQI